MKLTQFSKVSGDTLGKALMVLLLVSLVWLSLGCGVAAEPAAGPGPAPKMDVRMDSPEVGTQVGNRIPSFAMRLVDGTQVTSEELLKQGQPTFLRFFETW